MPPDLFHIEVKGIFDLLSRLRSRKPSKISQDKEGNAEFHVENEIITTEATVKDIFENEKIRTAIEDLTKISEAENISSIKINKAMNNEPSCEFAKGDIVHYRYVRDTPIVDTTKNEDIWGMEVVSPSFGQYAWRVIHQGQNFQVRVLDDKFRERIRNRDVRFGNGDQLRALVRKTGETRTGGNPQYGIIKVIEYSPAPDQSKLDLEL